MESSSKAAEAVEPPKAWTKDDTESWLLSHAIELCSGKEISSSVDLFEQGFDRSECHEFVSASHH